MILLARYVMFICLGSINTTGVTQNMQLNSLDVLGGKKKAVMPFKYIHHFIIVEAKLDGILPLQFIFDTGAEHVILFKKEYTDLLEVKYDRRIPVLGSDLSREIFALIARNSLIEVDGLAAKTHDLLVLEEDFFDLDEMIGTPVAGLLGGGFFKNLIIHIDYKRHQIVLYDPAYFQTPDDYQILPIHIKTNKPYIHTQVNLNDGTQVALELLIDTGAGVPLLLHNNSNQALHLPEQYIVGKLGVGLGGYLEGYIGRISNLSLGSLMFPGVLTSFQHVDQAWLDDEDKFRNGILGNELLSRLDIYFDYTQERIMFKPYTSKQKPFHMDRSGLVLFAFGPFFNQFAIRDILPNSPAAEADLRINDVLLKIQGIETRYFNLDGINRILQKKPGKRINFEILRGTELIRKKITLRDLI